MSTAHPRLRFWLLCLLGAAIGFFGFYAAGFLRLQRFSSMSVMAASLLFVSVSSICWKWFYWRRSLRRR